VGDNRTDLCVGGRYRTLSPPLPATLRKVGTKFLVRPLESAFRKQIAIEFVYDRCHMTPPVRIPGLTRRMSLLDRARGNSRNPVRSEPIASGAEYVPAGSRA